MFSTPRKFLHFLLVINIVSVLYVLPQMPLDWLGPVTDWFLVIASVGWLASALTLLSFFMTWACGGLTLEKWWP